MPRLHPEPLLFCFAWAALAIAGFVRSGPFVGAALTFGLMLLLMPASALIISRKEDFVLERQVRWGILVLAGLILGLYLRS